MNYQETLQYLFSRLPVFQHDGQSAYKPGLDNTKQLDRHLGYPHTKYKTIHVAGTNGKGSVSHLLASVLQHAGYRVGLYTSPHLKDFRERIRVNGQPVPEQYVCDFTEQHRAFFEEVNPSFFEATMSMAFQYFADERVDVAVIEVGLGGRLDSTNIITPELCVITNISFDHMNLLGNTLEKIAAEKAGIIKPNIPVVIGEAEGAIKEVFLEKAKAEKAPIFFAQEETSVKLLNSRDGKQTYDCTDFALLTIGLGGIYQQKNTATALTAIRELRKLKFNLPDQSVRMGFETVCETTGLQGRWQRLQTHPLVICDTGHNEGGIRYIVQQLQSLPARNLRVVFGMVNDKDIRTVLSLLPRQAIYYFCRANIPRALPSEDLQLQASEFGLKGDAFSSVQMALNTAKQEAAADDVIFVGGSTFVVAEVV
ncbi:MAG: bifunctional folylpolyglutamate synthase/dihydrofolate synthase [Paludibacteraceae bacterium]|nr:bifunctional folylpolyglutamate synthase/dihydrofolate synthase [Paludibacteraceae bacterium]